jgi:hypothetical protein
MLDNNIVQEEIGISLLYRDVTNTILKTPLSYAPTP